MDTVANSGADGNFKSDDAYGSTVFGTNGGGYKGRLRSTGRGIRIKAGKFGVAELKGSAKGGGKAVLGIVSCLS